ncbi:hypothetical protein [Roseomonas sp. BN140053]|uniref:hypothetical protein n=1 Tax=Roseomonas sp. BN140053 TaxID=3391898 RepID=UPI0039E8D3BB
MPAAITLLRAALLGGGLLLAACATQAPPTRLPPIASNGPQSPVINVIYGADAAFRQPPLLAGKPADAAVNVMRLEWLAEEVPRNITFTNFSSITGPAMGAARGAIRRDMGIAANAPAQLVIDSLERALPALASNDRAALAAALPAPVFSPDTPDRLAAMPREPEAVLAFRRAIRDLEFGRDDVFPLGM